MTTCVRGMAKNKGNKPKQAAKATTATTAPALALAPAWQIVAYQAEDKTLPALDWLLGSVPKDVRLELFKTLAAVSARDPRTFRSLGERWTFMRKSKNKGEVDMSGIAEVRDKNRNLLYRLFCVVDTNAADRGLDGASIVLLDGGVKEVRTKMQQSVYRRIDARRKDYNKTRRVAETDDYPAWWPKN